MKKKTIYILASILVISLIALIAAKPSGITHLTSLWVGDMTASNTVTPGDNDVYVNGTLEVDGGIYPASRGFIKLDLAGATVDSSNDIDDGTAPNITIADNIPVILWDGSAETTSVMWTIPVPPDYSSGLRLVAMLSSNTASGTPAVDWRLWFNKDNTDFGAASADGSREQSKLTSSLATVNSQCDVLTSTINSAGDASMESGAFITLEVYNANTHDSANTELKGLYLDYIRAL